MITFSCVAKDLIDNQIREF
nr:unnamed protein product [Callosobruchus chinensis]